MKIAKSDIFTGAMLLTPHTLVGIAIATAIPNPLIAAPLSFVMHFVGDKVPHWDFFSNAPGDEKLKGWRIFAVMAEFGLALAVGLTATLYMLWVKNDGMAALNVFLCGIASVLPDAMEAPYFYFNAKDKFSLTLLKIQKAMQFQAPLPWGIITQILVSGSALFLILNLIK